MAPAAIDDVERVYTTEIRGLLARRAFAELDEAAETARSSRARVGGGAWKLYEFYDVVAQPAGDDPTDRAWENRLALIQAWITARPSSLTARVALAQFYDSYGWTARGNGYADAVTGDAWEVFNARVSQAYKVLLEAAKLPEKCPQWYFVMMNVGRDLGWSEAQIQAVFESAISFEPSYYHYYREYALMLLPKWYGKPGDAEAFAEESYQQIGGRQGAFVYFEIATVIYCLCDSVPAKPALSWPEVQQGFNVMEKQYGATTLKLNRFALLAVLYHDRNVAKRIFGRIGNEWEPEVWRDFASFNAARQWAESPEPAAPKGINTF